MDFLEAGGTDTIVLAIIGLVITIVSIAQKSKKQNVKSREDEVHDMVQKANVTKVIENKGELKETRQINIPLIKNDVERYNNHKESYVEKRVQNSLGEAVQRSISSQNSTLQEYRDSEKRREKYANNRDKRIFAKNGDNLQPQNGESIIVCKYCGAKNIVPRYSSEEHNCYFCREIL